MTQSSYWIQPMTGTVHSDRHCSLGTARYGTVPCTLDDPTVKLMVASGLMKPCKRCYT